SGRKGGCGPILRQGKVRPGRSRPLRAGRARPARRAAAGPAVPGRAPVGLGHRSPAGGPVGRGRGRSAGEEHVQPAPRPVTVVAVVGRAPGRAAVGRRRGPVVLLHPLGLDAGQRLELAVVEEDPPAVRALVDVHAVAVIGPHDAMALWALHRPTYLPRRQITRRVAATILAQADSSASMVSGSWPSRSRAVTAVAACWMINARAGASSSRHGSPG